MKSLDKNSIYLHHQRGACSQTPWWINHGKYQGQNYHWSTVDQSKLVWLSKLGTALVCGLPLTAEWAQRGEHRPLPIGWQPSPHFLLDLPTRHLQDSNYHSGAAAPTAILPQQLPTPSMNYIANCSVTPTVTQSGQNKGKNREVETQVDMIIFINPDLPVLSSSSPPHAPPPLLRVPRGKVLKLSTSIPDITNYPKSSSLGDFKSNLISTLAQTSGILHSQQRLNKQSVQRIRYSTLRGETSRG